MSTGRLLTYLPNLPVMDLGGSPAQDINFIYMALHQLEDIISKLLPMNMVTASGLVWEHSGGQVAFGDSYFHIAPAQITLPANTTSYIEVDTSGNVQITSGGFTVGRIPIAQIITNNSAITQYTDKRALLRR